MSTSRIRLTHDAYRVGWISALPLEMAAAIAMLDASHAPLPQPKADRNTYHLGEIGSHNVVIACLPSGIYGLTSAAVVAKQMLSTFPSIDIGLMVGIGGGVPSATVDIRLGDVVVSKPTGLFSGVIQYDYGKTMADGSFHRTGSLNNPPESLLTAISNLQAKHLVGDNNIALHLENAAEARPSMQASLIYPGTSDDVLFEPSYVHENDRPSCAGCDKSKVITRAPRNSTVPLIHYGAIASANQVMKDALTRDRLANDLGILCFEMEAAGLMNHFPCLVIRGICDYSDSHKNKQWQDYAAATAAAYARELLQSSVPTTAAPARTNGVVKIRSKIPVLKSTFFGREAELQEVRESLDVTNRMRQAAVIWGLSGYGKTQLALEYLAFRDDDYDSLIWIDSSSRGMAEQSFEQISLKLGPRSNPQQSGAEKVLEWLEHDTNRSWIVVFDGVESIDDLDKVDDLDIRDYFPSCKHGHLLLVTTSPDLHLRLAFPGIQVEGVDEQTGAHILLKSAGAKSEKSASHGVAMTISRKLGGMPLAIEQAGSYLSYGVTSMNDYNKDFQSRFMDRTLKTPMRKYVGSYEKGRTLWTTFDMLYDALQRKSPDSVRLLQLIAFLGRGSIPFSTIVGGVNVRQDVFEGADSEDQRAGQLSLLAPWLLELRSESMVLASAVEELEISGFVKFHRSEGETVIETLVLHDLARSFLHSRASQDDLQDMSASALLLNALQLYRPWHVPEEDVLRRHMGRLLGVLDVFLRNIPNAMLQPPDGKYSQICAAVAPLYARICRYYGRLDTAAHIWGIVLQHRALSDSGNLRNSHSHQQDLMEAAGVDSRLGNLSGAIDKYSVVVSFFESCSKADNDICIKAAGRLRESRERLQRHERDSGRAIAALSAPKNIRRDRNEEEEGEEEGDWQSEEESEDDEEQELLARYEEDKQYSHHAAFASAQRLCVYYQLRDRPKKEAEFRQMIWKYTEQQYGPNHAVSSTAFRTLCDCYYESGELGNKIIDETYFALLWARQFGSRVLVDLLSSDAAPAILESLARGDLDTITTLVNSNEMDTAFCWATLQSDWVRDKVLHCIRSDANFAVVPLLLKVVERPWSGTAIEMILEWCKATNDCSDTDLGLALLCAVKSNNKPGASVLLSHGANVQYKSTSGDTPIHLAAQIESRSMIKLLMTYGAWVSQPNDQGRTPLHTAAISGMIIAVHALLDLGASVTQQDDHGRTAFHCAAAHDEDCHMTSTHADVVRLLTNYYRKDVEQSSGQLHGIAEVLNIQDCNGRTALHECSDIGNEDIYDILVHAGADPSILDNSGRDAFFKAKSIDGADSFSHNSDDARKSGDHETAADGEQGARETGMAAPVLDGDHDSKDHHREEQGQQTQTDPVKIQDQEIKAAGKERTGLRTRWRHWRQKSVPFRASRGLE